MAPLLRTTPARANSGRATRTATPRPRRSAPAGAGPPDTAALLLSADPRLCDEVARLAAGAGCALRTCDDLGDVRRSWPLGDVVLLGDDLVERVAALGVPRRSGVHVVADQELAGGALRAAVSVGSESVVELPADAARLGAVLGDLADGARSPGRVVGVVGGSGGLGASVLTVALAVTAARSREAVAVDLAPQGAGLDLVAGLEGASAVGWDTLRSGQGRLNSRALREALACRTGPPVLGWARTSPRSLPPRAVVAESLAAARRGHDLVVVDAATQDAWASCDAVVLLAGGSVPGVAAAGRVLEALPTGIPVGLAVRSARRDRWGPEVARALSLPLWTVLTHQAGLDEHLSAGLGPARRGRSPIVRSATEVLAALDTLP